MSNPRSLSAVHPLGDVEGDVRREGLGLGERVPELGVARHEAIGDREGIDALVQVLLRLKVEQLADDVGSAPGRGR